MSTSDCTQVSEYEMRRVHSAHDFGDLFDACQNDRSAAVFNAHLDANRTFHDQHAEKARLCVDEDINNTDSTAQLSRLHVTTSAFQPFAIRRLRDNIKQDVELGWDS